MTSAPTPTPPNESGDRRDEPAEVLVHVFGRTDVGRTREHNEDAFVVADLSTLGEMNFTGEEKLAPSELGTFFMVADGMGGAAAGEIASSMAVEIVLDEVRKRWRSAEAHDPDAFAAALRAATEVANARIHRYASEHPENRGMGTTATIAGLLGDTLYVSQVGDSRAYLVRDGVARQITKDQSLMQKLIEAGEITAAEAEQNERRNIILQALGPDAAIKIDLTHQKVRRGDVLVLCSDGLSGQVRDTDIARVVSEERDLESVCSSLIDLANSNGGPDNITVVAARFDGAGLEVAASDDEVGHRRFPMSDDDDTPTIPVERYVTRRSGPTPATGPAAVAASPVQRRPVPRVYLVLLGVAAVLAVAALAWQQLGHS